MKHTTGTSNKASADDRNIRVRVHLYLKRDKGQYKQGMNTIDFGVTEDRYAGQLKELAEILRGERPNSVELYDHDLRVHKVSLQACSL